VKSKLAGISIPSKELEDEFSNLPFALCRKKKTAKVTSKIFFFLLYFEKSKREKPLSKKNLL